MPRNAVHTAPPRFTPTPPPPDTFQHPAITSARDLDEALDMLAEAVANRAQSKLEQLQRDSARDALQTLFRGGSPTQGLPAAPFLI